MHETECMLDGVEGLFRPGAKKSTDSLDHPKKAVVAEHCQERSLYQLQWYLNIRHNITRGLPCKGRKWDMIEHNFNTDSVTVDPGSEPNQQLLAGEST